MNFSIKNNMRMKRFSLYFHTDNFKNKINIFKASVCAILFGVILGIIVVFLNGYNGFAYFGSLFVNSLDDHKYGDTILLNTTLQYFAVYILFGLGVSLGFKIGLFNMGGSGQAVLGMGLATMAIYQHAKATGVTFANVDKNYAIAVFMIFICAGILISSISGILKAFLNIHEVVTSIMLNWIAWFFIKWIDGKLIGNSDAGAISGQTPPTNATWFNIGNNPYILGLILAFGSVLITWAVLTFTTFGYKFKVVGLQRDAAKYAGIKTSLYIVVTTAVQGLFMGMGALIYYFQIETTITTSQDIVPTIGFDVIAIPLIAFNNLFGLIAVAFLWAVIKNGSVLSTGDPKFIGFTREMGSLVYGLVVYGAAIYSLFLRLKPFEKIKNEYFASQNWNIKSKLWSIKHQLLILKIKNKFSKLNKHVLIKKQLVDSLQEQFNSNKTDLTLKNKLKKAQEDYKFEIRSQKQIIKSTKKTLMHEYEAIKLEGAKDYIQISELSVRSNYSRAVRIAKYDVLDKLTRVQGASHRSITFEKENFNMFKKNFIYQDLENGSFKKIKPSFEDQEKIKKAKIELDKTIASIKKSTNEEMQKIILEYNDSFTSLKEKYLGNKVAAKRITLNNKKEFGSKIKNSKLDFSKELASKKSDFKKTYNEFIEEYKSDDDEEKRISLYNSFISKCEKKYFELEKTECYKLQIKYLEKQMEVANNYGRY